MTIFLPNRVIEVRHRTEKKRVWISIYGEEIIENGYMDNDSYEVSAKLIYTFFNDARLSTVRYPTTHWNACYRKKVIDKESFREDVSLTSSSIKNTGLFLDPQEWRGNGIGTYLMNEIVKWVKKWPEAWVYPIELLPFQARGENKVRRYKFYNKFGINFENEDIEEGYSKEMQVKQLILQETSKNITECDHLIRDYTHL